MDYCSYEMVPSCPGYYNPYIYILFGLVLIVFLLVVGAKLIFKLKNKRLNAVIVALSVTLIIATCAVAYVKIDEYYRLKAGDRDTQQCKSNSILPCEGSNR
jgi:hypothetical protein